jgi:hypothetical protein
MPGSPSSPLRNKPQTQASVVQQTFTPLPPIPRERCKTQASEKEASKGEKSESLLHTELQTHLLVTQFSIKRQAFMPEGVATRYASEFVGCCTAPIRSLPKGTHAFFFDWPARIFF